MCNPGCVGKRTNIIYSINTDKGQGTGGQGQGRNVVVVSNFRQQTLGVRVKMNGGNSFQALSFYRDAGVICRNLPRARLTGVDLSCNIAAEAKSSSFFLGFQRKHVHTGVIRRL